MKLQYNYEFYIFFERDYKSFRNFFINQIRIAKKTFYEKVFHEYKKKILGRRGMFGLKY